MRTERRGIALGALGVAILCIGGLALADDEQAGDQTASPGNLQFAHTGNGPCHQYNVGEWLHFADQHVNNDPPAPAGVNNYNVWYTIDIFQWVGARGAWIAGANDFLGPNNPGNLHAPPNVGNAMVNTQVLNVQYNGWNGAPSCWTFEIVRTMRDNAGGNPPPDDFLL
jgi:hypothetical protein